MNLELRLAQIRESADTPFDRIERYDLWASDALSEVGRLNAEIAVIKNEPKKNAQRSSGIHCVDRWS